MFSLISFFYVMPLNLHDPASIFRSRTTARLFIARSLIRWYRFNGSLFYLSYLTYLNRFIKSSLIKLWYAPFRVHGCIIHYGSDKCQTNVRVFKKNLENFFKLCTMRGMRFIPLCTWHTSALCVVFCTLFRIW